MVALCQEVGGRDGLVPVQLLRLLGYLKFNSFLFCDTILVSLVVACCYSLLDACYLRIHDYSRHIPRSLMFLTSALLELVRLLATFLSSLGDDERPLTAESTLERSCVSAAMM